jgi:hypothetical protein
MSKAAAELINDIDPVEATEPERAASVNAKPFSLDMDNYQFTLRDKFGEFTGGIMGVPQKVLAKLALRGAVAMLRGRKNREKLWDDIREGRFDKGRKKYPIVVMAYAAVQKITVEQAMEQWGRLSTAEKYQVRSLPQIRMEVARMQGGDQPLL